MFSSPSESCLARATSVLSHTNQFIAFRTKKSRKKITHKLSGDNFRNVGTTSSSDLNNLNTQRKTFFKYPPADNRAIHYHVKKYILTTETFNFLTRRLCRFRVAFLTQSDSRQSFAFTTLWELSSPFAFSYRVIFNLLFLHSENYRHLSPLATEWYLTCFYYILKIVTTFRF